MKAVLPVAPAATTFRVSATITLTESLYTRIIVLKECLKFRSVAQCAAAGGTSGAVLNAANEVAVAAFLDGRRRAPDLDAMWEAPSDE